MSGPPGCAAECRVEQLRGPGIVRGSSDFLLRRHRKRDEPDDPLGGDGDLLNLVLWHLVVRRPGARAFLQALQRDFRITLHWQVRRLRRQVGVDRPRLLREVRSSVSASPQRAARLPGSSCVALRRVPVRSAPSRKAPRTPGNAPTT